VHDGRQDDECPRSGVIGIPDGVSCRVGPRSHPRPSAPSVGGRSGSTSPRAGARPSAKTDEDPAAAVEAPKGDCQGHVLPHGDE
jgi:hypothetical protein